jgi:phage terminase large subunit
MSGATSRHLGQGDARGHEIRRRDNFRTDSRVARGWQQFGIEPDEWQVEVLRAFPDPLKPRISMQACAGPGKTAVEAWCVWNFLTCYAEKGEHPKGAGVSITGDNLDQNLWPELAKWQGRSAFLTNAFTWTKTRIFANDHPEKRGSSPRAPGRRVRRRTSRGRRSRACTRFVLFVIDESGAIPTTVMRAAEQSLSICAFGKILQAGNPISLEGMLYAAATTSRISGTSSRHRRSGRPEALAAHR